ncbi:hypothetical protein B0T16DRAFT_486784 [Cercophora newfieldiana]|uniref:Uncharacterized protein n=1 Tax=Cercophora newfieldiana TaxID=92897 RepID=A0AA40CXL2_9PEZI|nr:hypothetical protein B0T16DRAFT_486784 [Cercophora newfieldiana]
MSGFSVFQPTLGAALQWLPALGTAELDEMIHAAIPGSSSIADKRAHVAMDFFEFSQQTGKNFKFYPAPASFASTSVPSPASSSALYDSGYGSSFNASPVVSDMSPWTPSSVAYTPSLSAEEISTKPRSASRKSTASSTKQADFSNHPGMRIMTKDGRDVTNSASRGCKTKEQRDHAHLMRIIKACDACKRKKIRCDPSHKKRTASASSQQEAKPAKKVKKASQPPAPAWDIPDFTVPIPFDTQDEPSSSPFQTAPEDELWSQFVLFDQEPTTLATDFRLDDYDFSDTFDFGGVTDFFTPSSSTSSSSPSQLFTPYTPAPPGPSPPVISTETLVDTSPQDLNLPYLNPGSHGSDYVDFNLYSPPADFFLDEEPLPARKEIASGTSRQQSPQSGGVGDHAAPTQQFTEGIVAASRDEYYSSLSCFSDDTFHNDGQQSSVRRLDEYRYATSSLTQSFSGGRQLNHAQDDSILQGPDSSGALQSVSQPSSSGAHASSPTLSQQTDKKSGRHKGYSRGSQLQEPSGTSRPPHTSIQSEIVTYGSRGVTQTSGIGRPTEYYDPGIPAPSPTSSAVNVQVSASFGSATRGRPLSTGQQLQTASTHGSATLQPSPTQPRESMVPGLVERSRVSVSPSVSVPGEYCSVASASPLAVSSYPESSSYLDSRAAPSTSSGGTNGHAITAALATMLFTTLPIRRLVDGELAKNGQPLSSKALFQLAVFGLISSLLAFALQNNFMGHQADLHVCLIITSITFASMHQRCTGLSATMWRPSATPLPAPTPTSTIDNVKTKIQAMGQKVDGLRCAMSQRLRAFLPRQRSLNSIRF